MIAAAAIGMIAIAQTGVSLSDMLAGLDSSTSRHPGNPASTALTAPARRWPFDRPGLAAPGTHGQSRELPGPDYEVTDFVRPLSGDPGDPGSSPPWPAPRVDCGRGVSEGGRIHGEGPARPVDRAPLMDAVHTQPVVDDPIGGDPGDPGADPSNRIPSDSGKDSTGGGSAG
jgi:hypothetical protein